MDGLCVRYAKLSDDDVRRIREMTAEGRTLREVADEFGVSVMAVWQIRKGTSFKEVA